MKIRLVSSLTPDILKDVALISTEESHPKNTFSNSKSFTNESAGE